MENDHLVRWFTQYLPQKWWFPTTLPTKFSRTPPRCLRHKSRSAHHSTLPRGWRPGRMERSQEFQVLSGPPQGGSKSQSMEKTLGSLEMFFAKPRNAEVEPLGISSGLHWQTWLADTSPFLRGSDHRRISNLGARKSVVPFRTRLVSKCLSWVEYSSK